MEGRMREDVTQQPKDYEFIIYEKIGPVARITFNRPEKLNALNEVMNAELRAVLREAQEDDKVRVLVMTGAGRAFSAGEDMTNMGRGMIAQAEQAQASDGIRNVRTPAPAAPQGRLLHDTVQKPTIAAVNGVAAGGGYALALASDIRFASTAARFAHIYLRRALVAGGEAYWLAKHVGLGNALYHILSADELDAEEAYRIGLVQKVFPPEKLMDETMAFAERLAEGPAVALKFTKMAVERSLLSTFDETMEFVGWARNAAASSGETREGARAFLEKRKPNFMS